MSLLRICAIRPSPPVHPDDALFSGEKTFPILPVCEHFAGNEKLIRKALQLQEQLGPVFDITCDCEDGAQAGNEIEHAGMVACGLAYVTIPKSTSVDGAGIRSDALRAYRQFGFQRMWSIHPAQIAFIVDAMRPDLNEIEDASAIIWKLEYARFDSGRAEYFVWLKVFSARR